MSHSRMAGQRDSASEQGDIEPLLSGYRPPAGTFDEMVDREGRVRAHWQPLLAMLARLGVQSRSVVESAMLMLHSGRPYGTDSSRQRQDHARRPSCYTAIEGFDPRARQPLRS